MNIRQANPGKLISGFEFNASPARKAAEGRNEECGWKRFLTLLVFLGVWKKLSELMKPGEHDFNHGLQFVIRSPDFASFSKLFDNI